MTKKKADELKNKYILADFNDDQQKADREANKQQTLYHQKYTSMTQKEVVEHLQKTEPERIAKTGHSLNIGKFLENKGASSDPNVPILKFGAQSVQDVAIQKPIDVSQITDSSWMRPKKQTEARQTLADFETIPSQIPTVQQETPTSRRMGFGQGGGAANLGLGYQTITEPTSFTDYAFGRINTPARKQAKKNNWFFPLVVLGGFRN